MGAALTPFSSGAVFIRVLTVTQEKNTMPTKPIYTRPRRYVRPPYTQQGVKDRDCRVTVAALGLSQILLFQIPGSQLFGCVEGMYISP